MKAVWSLWTKPLAGSRRIGWTSLKHHLFAWVLSVETARRHYPYTALVADDQGAEMLVNGIGLNFTEVSTELNALEDHDPDWWALGKVYAYALQSEPFVHLDNDVFLWQRLPERLERAPVLAQCPELFNYGASTYQPERLNWAIRQMDGWLPAEMDCYLPIRGLQTAVNCGILGGNRVDFIQYYARLALELVEHPANAEVWPILPDKLSVSLMFEQYLLAACVEYHHDRPGSPFQDIAVQYLFDSFQDAFTQADSTGFTHLLADAKQNPLVLARLENRVHRDYPAYYARCIRYAERMDR